MSLGTWIARKYAERWVRDAGQGKKGASMKAVIDWLHRHKGGVGLVFGAAAAGVHFLAGADPRFVGWDTALGLVGTFLVGAGFMESDRAKKSGY